MSRTCLAYLAIAAALAACGTGAGTEAVQTPHTTISPGVDELRAAFNDGADRVRVVLLLSPT